MKKNITILLSLTSLLCSSYGAFSLSGTALTNPVGVNAGDVAVYLVSTDGTSFETGLSSIAAGVSLTDSATYGSSFSTFTASTSAVASEFIGTISVGSGVSTSLAGGITTGDQFGILVYEASTTNTLVSDSYRIYTDASWLVGTDGTFNFGSDYSTLAAEVPGFTGNVVPESSTYAALAGLCALSVVMVRRRRA